MEFTQLDHLRQSIDEMTLEDLHSSILVEMNSKPAFSREVTEYLLQAYTNKLAELYY
ncbi:hypothetical protein ABZ353_10895 [Streptomyces niveus]|uniref:hypothetical protein n=1 Tax=Streptomyces niveus TaxID=193462 RepID=UPI0033FBAA5E